MATFQLFFQSGRAKDLSVLLFVLFVCKCVLYHCHRVSTQLQLTNISYHIIYQKSSRLLWNLNVHDRVHKSLPLVSVLSQLNPVRAQPPYPVSKWHITIVIATPDRRYLLHHTCTVSSVRCLVTCREVRLTAGIYCTTHVQCPLSGGYLSGGSRFSHLIGVLIGWCRQWKGAFNLFVVRAHALVLFFTIQGAYSFLNYYCHRDCPAGFRISQVPGMCVCEQGAVEIKNVWSFASTFTYIVMHGAWIPGN